MIGLAAPLGGRPPEDVTRMTLARLSLFAVLALLAGSGCGSPAHLPATWRDPTADATPLRKVFVLAIMKENLRRHVWEDTYARELASHGAAATPSYTIYGDSLPTAESLKRDLAGKGYDGLLATWDRGTREEKTVVPGRTTRETTVTYDKWWRSYDTVSKTVTTPTYVETDHIKAFEIGLWTPSHPDRERPLWSAYADLSNPTNPTSNSDYVVKKVVSELEKEGLLEKP
jgi:hypothetical protein